MGFAQQRTISVDKGKLTAFKGHFYVCGIKTNTLKILRFDKNLQIKDSAEYKLDKSKAEDYLSIETDTLHDLLTVQLQKKDRQNALLLRFTPTLELKNEFKNLEVTKLNPLSGFGHQKFISGNAYYVVKSATDSTGKQYYLSRYDRENSATKAFEMKFRWQFNFEKQHIRNIHVFYADDDQVLVFVHINNGERKGQWILKINALNGLLIKAKRLNNNPNITYRYAHHHTDSISKEIVVVGQVTAGEQLASATPSLFIWQADSLLGLIEQKNFPLKIQPSNPKPKTVAQYIFQLPKLQVSPLGVYTLELDLYKQANAEFKYANTSVQSFTIDSEGISFIQSPIKEFMEVENYFFSTDKQDLNGKLLQDTTWSSDRLFYKPMAIPSKTAFKLNDVGQPIWILRKYDVKTNKILYVQIAPGKKIYETTTLIQQTRETEPTVVIMNDRVLISHSPSSDKLQLELRVW